MLLSSAFLALVPTALATAQPASPPAFEPLSILDPAPVTSIGPAVADDSGSVLSYTYIEAGAIQFDVDDIDEDVDSFYGRGSLGLFDFLYLFGEYENQSTDFENTDTDLIKLGAGVHFGLTPEFDVFAEVGYLFSDISSDIDEIDDSTDGYEVQAGVRWLVLPWDGGGLELTGATGFVDMETPFSEDDQAWGWEAGARVHFLEMLSVGASYIVLEDADAFAANVRFSF